MVASLVLHDKSVDPTTLRGKNARNWHHWEPGQRFPQLCTTPLLTLAKSRILSGFIKQIKIKSKMHGASQTLRDRMSIQTPSPGAGSRGGVLSIRRACLFLSVPFAWVIAFSFPDFNFSNTIYSSKYYLNNCISLDFKTFTPLYA